MNSDIEIAISQKRMRGLLDMKDALVSLAGTVQNEQLAGKYQELCRQIDSVIIAESELQSNLL